MGTLPDYLGGVDTPLCRVPVPNNRGKLSKYLGEGWSISQLLLGPHTPNTFWRCLGHIEIFLDYLRGVQIPVGRVWVPRNKAKLSKYMGSGRSIFQLLLKPLATHLFGRFLRHIGTFVDHLGGVDTPLCRVQVPNNRGKLTKYLGEGWSIFQLLLGPHTPNTFWRFLRHIGTFVDYLGGVDTRG